MEPICIAHSSQTRTMDRELYWAYIFNNKKSLTRLIVSYAIMLIFTIYLAFEAYPKIFRAWEYLEIKTQLLALLSVALFGTSLIRIVFRAHFYANKRAKNRRKILGDKPSYSEYLFYGDRFLYRCNSDPSENWVVYAGVKKVKETAHLYILITDSTLYSFDKAGFVRGSWEQLLSLIPVQPS